MTVGERIKHLRKRKGLTQAQFAEQIGIAGASLSTIESGKNGASNSTIKAICTIYNVSETWLRTGEGEMFEELDPDEELMRFVGQITKDENSPLYRLAQKMAQMPPEVLEHLSAVIEYALAEEQKKDV